jgi:hypothetical protein
VLRTTLRDIDVHLLREGEVTPRFQDIRVARGWGDIDWAGLARLSAVNAGLEG